MFPRSFPYLGKIPFISYHTEKSSRYGINTIPYHIFPMRSYGNLIAIKKLIYAEISERCRAFLSREYCWEDYEKDREEDSDVDDIEDDDGDDEEKDENGGPEGGWPVAVIRGESSENQSNHHCRYVQL